MRTTVFSFIHAIHGTIGFLLRVLPFKPLKGAAGNDNMVINQAACRKKSAGASLQSVAAPAFISKITRHTRIGFGFSAV